MSHQKRYQFENTCCQCEKGNRFEWWQSPTANPYTALRYCGVCPHQVSQCTTCKTTETPFFTDSPSFCWEVGLIAEHDLPGNESSSKPHDVWSESDTKSCQIFTGDINFYFQPSAQGKRYDLKEDQQSRKVSVRQTLAGQESQNLASPYTFLQNNTSKMQEMYSKLYDLQNLKGLQDEIDLPEYEKVQLGSILLRGFSQLRKEASTEFEASKAFARKSGTELRSSLNQLYASRMLDINILQFRDIMIDCDIGEAETADRVNIAEDENIARRGDLPETEWERNSHARYASPSVDTPAASIQQIKSVKELPPARAVIDSCSLASRGVFDDGVG